MSEQKRDRTDKELLDAIEQLFSEVEPETPEEIDAAIKSVGYDPNSFAARIEEAAKQFASDSKFNWRNKARRELELERKRLELRSSSKKVVAENVRAKIQDLLAQLGNRSIAFSTHHRNLDEASDDDLISLLEELQYLINTSFDNEK